MPASPKAPSILLLVAFASLALTAANLLAQLPLSLWAQATLSPDLDDIRQILFHHDRLPRIVVALICGAAIGIAGAVLQHVFANPLAEPGTLGLAAGSQLALVLLLLAAPDAGAAARDAAALCGALVCMGMVAFVAVRSGSSPLAVIVAGLTISLAVAAAANVLLLFNERYLTSLFIWSSGSLVQNDWSVATALPLKLAMPMVLLLATLRPIAVLGLGSGTAQSLGLSAPAVRALAIGAASMLAAFVTAAVGVLAFLGLAAPALARLSGARTLKARLGCSALFGALLLLLADAAVLAAADRVGTLPTGAVIALIGAPLLIFMARRPLSAHPPANISGPDIRGNVRTAVFIGLAALAAAVLLAALIGRTAGGLAVLGHADGDMTILALRIPRIVAAASCGVLLAIGGVVIQRMTANPLAAPELTGVSAGAATGVIAAMLLAPAGGFALQSLCGAGGAFVALSLLLSMSRSAGFSSERLILVGLALTTAMSALVSVLLASGDPRLSRLLTWMAGSTYGLDGERMVVVSAAAAAFFALALLLLRWLDLLPLGETVSRALGVRIAASRALMILIVAGATAVATLVVGPITFVGLLAPAIARAAGSRRALPELLVAALAGAVILVVADWIGRQAAFPRQIPTGLLASVVGGPLLLCLLWLGRSKR